VNGTPAGSQPSAGTLGDGFSMDIWCLDDATPIDALHRRLRWIRPPTASIAFRHQAWREFEHALDPLDPTM
jgi:hypothetical protein